MWILSSHLDIMFIRGELLEEVDTAIDERYVLKVILPRHNDMVHLWQTKHRADKCCAGCLFSALFVHLVVGRSYNYLLSKLLY